MTTMREDWRRRSWWGWGYESEQINGKEFADLLQKAGPLLHLDAPTLDPPSPGSIHLTSPRIKVPESLSSITVSDNFARLLHTYGCSYKDVVRCNHSGTLMLRRLSLITAYV